MKKIVNGKSVEMTSEEIAALEAERRRAELMELTRPMTADEVYAMLIAEKINTLAVDDNTALRMLAYYPGWSADTAYTQGYKIQHRGKLWRCVQGHTAQLGWEPENAASLWEQINETHSGTLDDPIPYDGNMGLESGKHYVQNYVIYLCTRDTVNPVYDALSALVGLYVEEII